MEDYLKEEYDVFYDPKYLRDVEQISDYFKDNGYDLFDCGQGYSQDKAVVIVMIDDKFYEVSIVADIGSSWQDRGDRLYFVDGIESVTYKEIPKPERKDRFFTTYTMYLTNDEVLACEKFLGKFQHLDPHTYAVVPNPFKK